jgi:hypothetical protein
MANKFYMKTNALNPVSAGGKIIKFEVAMHTAGVFYGTYKTDDKATQDDLDKLVEAKKVKSITAEEYQEWEKKRTRYTSNTVTVSQPIGQETSRQPAGASAEPAKSEPKPAEKVESEDSSIEELSETQPVEEPMRVISYKDLAKQLGVEADSLKALAKREDAPKRSKKGFLVSEWAAFVKKVSAEESQG